MRDRIISVQSNGIYHGLPVYPDNIKDLSALVVGANGISGQAMVSALAANPERWSQIYSLSRKMPSSIDSEVVKPLLIDLLDGPEAISESLKEHLAKM